MLHSSLLLISTSFIDFSSQFKPKRLMFFSLFQVLNSYSGIRSKECALSARVDGEEWTPTPGGA